MAVASAIARSAGATARIDTEAELGRVGLTLGAPFGGEDAEILERLGVLDETAGKPAHDVVGQRFCEGDLGVPGDPLRLKAPCR